MCDNSDATLIARLNDDLAREYAAVIQYRTYASLVRGSHRPALRRIFARHAAVALAHAELLADKIAVLGGLPTVGVAPVEHETEPDAMLRRLCRARSTAIDRYAILRRVAGELAEYGLAVEMDALVADETRHRDELTQLLAGRESARDVGSFERAHDRAVRVHRPVGRSLGAYAAAERGDHDGSGSATHAD
jgi:bacterioferritin